MNVYYIECFGKLKTAYSKSRLASYKVLLLLSVTELIEKGVPSLYGNNLIIGYSYRYL